MTIRIAHSAPERLVRVIYEGPGVVEQTEELRWKHMETWRERTERHEGLHRCDSRCWQTMGKWRWEYAFQCLSGREADVAP